jgi:hypothetical protein
MSAMERGGFSLEEDAPGVITATLDIDMSCSPSHSGPAEDIMNLIQKIREATGTTENTENTGNTSAEIRERAITILREVSEGVVEIYSQYRNSLEFWKDLAKQPFVNGVGIMIDDDAKNPHVKSVNSNEVTHFYLKGYSYTGYEILHIPGKSIYVGTPFAMSSEKMKSWNDSLSMMYTNMQKHNTFMKDELLYLSVDQKKEIFRALIKDGDFAKHVPELQKPLVEVLQPHDS